jgi:hypothetical protein
LITVKPAVIRSNPRCGGRDCSYLLEGFTDTMPPQPSGLGLAPPAAASSLATAAAHQLRLWPRLPFGCPSLILLPVLPLQPLAHLPGPEIAETGG